MIFIIKYILNLSESDNVRPMAIDIKLFNY